MVKTVLRHCLSLLFLVVLSGCVAGQNIRMTYEPLPETAAVQDVAVSVQVSDDRPFVTSGNKPPSYIGHYRAGFGNTWDVNTQGLEPLAEMIQRDLGEDLQSMGFTLVPLEDSTRVVKVSIVDWNFDTYINGKFWYDIRVRALDGAGKELSEIHLQDTAVIEGSFWVGAKYAFEREMPILYRSIIRKMVRGAPSMMAALKE